MLYLISSQQFKPDRVATAESAKDVQYHTKYARWAVGQGLNRKQREYVERYNTNMSFYKNKQWVLREDLEAFFKDESGQDRNRIKVTQNYIQPMVEQYRGNAERMTFDVKAQALSPMAKSRRDQSLGRLLNLQAAGKAIPEFGEYLKKSGYPVENTEDATSARFENLYVDKYIIAMNRLLRYVANVSKIDKYKRQLAMDVALAGIGIMEPYPYNGEWMFRRVLPDRFGWDRGAIEQDLSDADFFFEFDFALATNIYEQYNIGVEEKSTIEKYISNVGGRQSSGVPYDIGYRVPVYTAKWRDTVTDRYGYVTDQFGQRILERINHTPDNEEKPSYTMGDVIPVSDLTVYQKKVLKGNNTRTMSVDLWRHCKFIPYEIMTMNRRGASAVKDITLDWGIVPYQEPDLYLPTNMMPPYKIGTWLYADGEVLSPIDVAISPQRIMNRFLSVMENQINNAGGSGPIYDKDLLGNESEDDIIAKMKRGEPIGVHGKARGVSQAVGKYDAGIKESTMVFATLVESFRIGMEQVTGVNEGLKGQTSGNDQLVGVMQLMIQRGSILQEPFYSAIADIYQGCYQSIATSAKRYYIDLDVELMDAVGIESAEVLKLSKDMRPENFRAILTRTVDLKTEKLYVDQRTLLWLQYGLIDHETSAMLLGRATDEEAIDILKEFQKRQAEIKRKQAATQEDAVNLEANAKEKMGEVVYDEQLRQEAREDDNAAKERAGKRDVAIIKGASNK